MSPTSLEKNRIRILLLEGVDTSAVEAFRQDGYTDIEFHEKSLPEEKLMEAISNAYLIGIRSNTQLTRRVLEQAGKLIGIGCYCIGTNQVDLDAAQEFGTPYSMRRSPIPAAWRNW